MILKHLNFLEKCTDSTLKHLSELKLDFTEMLLFNFLERVRNSSVSLKLLIDQYDNGVQAHDYSIGIIIRSLMLDALIGISVYKRLLDYRKEGISYEVIADRLNYYSEGILCDGFDKTLQYAEQLKTHGFKTNEELQEFYNAIATTYSHFFEAHEGKGEKPILKVYSDVKISGNKLFNAIANEPELKNLSKIYDTYMIYSKYDHISIHSLTLLRLQEGKSDTIEQAVEHVLLHSFLCHSTLCDSKDDDMFLREQYYDLGKYVEESFNQKIIK